MATCTFQVSEYEAQLDKKRWLYRVEDSFFLFDKLLSLDLIERIKPILPKEVLSFQKGLGPHDAVKAIQDFVSMSGRDGLFVIKTDIRSYTDSIQVTDGSPLWDKFRELKYSDHELSHLKSVLRPQIKGDLNSGERQRIVGVPTGLALTPIVANLYAIDLDRAAISTPGIFYRRYGDDIVLASKDPELINHCWDEMLKTAKILKLEFHPEKTKKLFWCRNGFTPIGHSDFKGTQYLGLLGFEIQYLRGLRLNKEKMHELKNGFVKRVLRTRDLLARDPLHGQFEERAQILVSIANRYFDLRSRANNGRVSDFYTWVNEQGQIAELEDFCARILTQAISELKGTRAYSKVSWKELIQKWNWKSPRYQWIKYRSQRAT